MFKTKITILFTHIIAFQFSIAGEYIQDIPCYVAPPYMDIISTKLKYEKRLNYSDKDAENFDKISKNEDHFPYRLSTKNQRGKVSGIMGYSINPPKMFDDEKGHEEINKLIDIFKTTSFFSSVERSKLEFSEKACLFLLLNRPRSVSQIVNDYLFSTVNKVEKAENIFVRATLWEPSWKYTNGTKVNFSKVEEYFQKLVQYDNDKKTHLAERFLTETEYQSEWKQQIPYRELRELLRTDKEKSIVIKKLREKFPEKPIYQCIHDSDITNLRIRTKGKGHFIENIGLYSYYDKLIINNNAPDLLTTGYSAHFDNKNPSIEELKVNIAISKAIDFDMELRSKMSKMDPRFAYIPEPNFIVKIDEGKEMMEYSFLGTKKDYNNGKYTSPLESCNVLMSMLEKKPNAKIIFDYKHPIQMKLPYRMKFVKQGRGHSPFTLDNIDLHKLAQSSFDIMCESKIVYKQFGFIGINTMGLATPNCKFTSFFCSLLNDSKFKPELEEIFGSREGFELKFLEKFNLTIEFLNKLKQIKNIIIQKKEKFSDWKEKIKALTEKQVKIYYLLKNSKYSMMKNDILSILDIEDKNNEWQKSINALRKNGFVQLDASGKRWITIV